MKLSSWMFLMCGLVVGLAGTHAKAQPLVDERFAGYPDDALISQSPAGPALGLTGDWTLTPNSDFYVNRTQLDLNAGTGKAVYDRPSGDNGTREASRMTSADHVLVTNDGDVFFASFLADVPVTSGRMTLELRLERLDGGGTPTFSFGLLDGGYAVGNGGSDVDVSGGSVFGGRQLVVVRVEYGDGGTGPDDAEVVTIWVDPLSEASPRAVDEASVDFLNRGGARLVAVAIRGELMAGQPASFDDLRVGATFSDVVVPAPVPTASGWGLAVLGLLVLSAATLGLRQHRSMAN